MTKNEHKYQCQNSPGQNKPEYSENLLIQVTPVTKKYMLQTYRPSDIVIEQHNLTKIMLSSMYNNAKLGFVRYISLKNQGDVLYISIHLGQDDIAVEGDRHSREL